MSSRTKVLVTEDEAIVAMEIEDRLKELSYDVVGTVATGEDAVALAEKHVPDIVLMDIMLLGEMDGIETAEIIRRRFDIPVVFLTAYSDEDTLKKAQATEPFAYLLKPFTGRELHTNIEIALYRHKIEKRLRESEAQYRAFIEGTNDLVQSVSIDGKIQFVNSAWLDTLGYSREESLQLSLEDITTVETLDDMKEAFRLAKSGRDVLHFEVSLKSKSESKVYVEGNVFSRVKDDRIISIVSFFRDVTRRKMTENALQRAADSAKLYIDLMSHDLRQSLQAITSGLEILDSMAECADARPIMDLMFDAVDKSDSLIRKVQSTREFLKEPLSEIDMVTVLYDVLSNFEKRSEEISLHSEIEIDEAIVRADRYLSILLSNLIENAFIHSKKDTKNIWAKLSPSNGGYEFSISDDGVGIPDARKISLFDPKRRFGGVGLHQSLHIVQKYGGTLKIADRIENDFSRGAMFIVWLPKAVSNQE